MVSAKPFERPAIIDGEVVCLDDAGKTSFRELQQRFHLEDAAEIRRRMEHHPAFLYVFDILYLDRSDVTRLPLSRRRELLDGGRGLVRPNPPTGSVPGEGSRHGSEPAKPPRRGSSASGWTASMSRAEATPG